MWRRTSPTTRERLYHYQYDANGNRIGWALPTGSCNPTVSTCTRVDEQDRLLSAGGVSYRYDLQGQLATRTEGTRAETFTYDMAGNLRTFVVREGGTQTRHVEYAIDAFGRRVGRYVGTSGATIPDRFWVYQDGLNPVAQLNATGQLELLFLYGTQAHVPDLVVEVRGAGAADDVVYRVVTDQVGSVRRLVNVETGAVAASFDYSPFGVLEREDGALAARFPFRFAGGLWDGDTGLVRFGARDYDPRVGRWTAKDPILWSGGTTSLYQYVSCDPVNRADINGLEERWYDSLNTAHDGWLMGVSNFLTGVADTASLGVGPGARELIFGDQDPTDECSAAYNVGTWVGFLAPGGVAGKAVRAARAPTVLVSRWGRAGLVAGDWVMLGSKNWWNYLKSGKLQPGWFFGRNRPAPYSSGEMFRVPIGSLSFPKGEGLLGWIKGAFLGQRTFNG